MQVCVEKQRFEKLMEHFRNEDNNIDFMVSEIFHNLLLFPAFPFPGPGPAVSGTAVAARRGCWWQKSPKSGGLKAVLECEELKSCF